MGVGTAAAPRRACALGLAGVEWEVFRLGLLSPAVGAADAFLLLTAAAGAVERRRLVGLAEGLEEELVFGGTFVLDA